MFSLQAIGLETFYKKYIKIKDRCLIITSYKLQYMIKINYSDGKRTLSEFACLWNRILSKIDLARDPKHNPTFLPSNYKILHM